MAMRRVNIPDNLSSIDVDKVHEIVSQVLSSAIVAAQSNTTGSSATQQLSALATQVGSANSSTTFRDCVDGNGQFRRHSRAGLDAAASRDERPGPSAIHSATLNSSVGTADANDQQSPDRGTYT